jgi:hypothetical protein
MTSQASQGRENPKMFAFLPVSATSQINAAPHRKTMKMQHFLEELHLPLGVSKIRSDRKILGRNEPTKVCLKTG